jgi:hypothetical protein
MDKIYVLGHGIMSSIAGGQDTVLRYDFHTYVMDGKMYDSSATPSLIDSGGGNNTYNPKFASSQADAQYKRTEKNNLTPTHWLLTDRLQSIGDLKGCKTFDELKKMAGWGQKALISLGQDAGFMYKLTADSYVYMSSPGILTSLRVIQEVIGAKLGSELDIHWLACRSYVDGSNGGQVFKNASGSMPGVEPTKVWD